MIDDANAFPDISHKGACTSGICRIFDMRTSSAGNLTARSYYGSTLNNPFTSGSACPSEVQGNQTLNWNSKVFLKHAIEVGDDHKGNDDGLCESNEDCIYAPNIGGYQGEGDFNSNGTCIFSPSSVSGVTMFAYPIIGI
jgi:hypothetical protein